MRTDRKLEARRAAGSPGRECRSAHNMRASAKTRRRTTRTNPSSGRAMLVVVASQVLLLSSAALFCLAALGAHSAHLGGEPAAGALQKNGHGSPAIELEASQPQARAQFFESGQKNQVKNPREDKPAGGGGGGGGPGATTAPSTTTTPRGTTTGQAANDKRRLVESLLVRELSDLIMNNEPEVIQRKLTSEQVNGRLVAETNRLLGASRPLLGVRLARRPLGEHPESANDEPSELEDEPPEELEFLDDLERATESSSRYDSATGGGGGHAPVVERQTTPDSSLRSEKKRRHMDEPAQPQPPPADPGEDPAGTLGEFLQDPQQDQQQQQQQQQFANGEGDQQQSVTCSPDYEDQTILVDPNEFFAGPGGNNNNNPPLGASQAGATNLTQEQRQQLLSGVDASGLLQSQANSSAPGAGGPQLLLDPGQLVPRGGGGQLAHQMIGQCVPAGSRMIEVITKVITPILFTIIIIVGLLGNIIVMLVILEDRKVERELTPTNLLILDLSLADLSFIIFCIPFTGWDYAVGHWVFGSLWCKFNQYLIVVCALSSIYTLVLMSCDRFMAIVYPIECISYRTSRNMLHAIVIKWIVILAIASPTILMHGLIDSPLGPDQYNCRFLSDQFNPLHFQFIFFITSYFLPLVLIFFLYLSLLRRLWCGQKPHGHKESTKMLESKKKVTWLVASIVLVFAACWFPIQIMLILMRLKTHKITATYVAVQVFAHTLGYMNSCVNPIVYAFASDTFNQSFKKSRLGRLCLAWFCCQPTSSSTGGANHFGANTTTNGHNYHASNYLGGGPTTTCALDVPGGGRRGTGGGGGFNTRSSLQIQTGGEQAGRSNKSLNNIFSPTPLEGPAVVVAAQVGGPGANQPAERSPKPLALEPRDRPQLVVRNPPQGQQRVGTSTSANQLQGEQATGGEQVAKAASANVPKQQLVARMVQSSSNGASGRSFAHDCRRAPACDDTCLESMGTCCDELQNPDGRCSAHEKLTNGDSGRP